MYGSASNAPWYINTHGKATKLASIAHIYFFPFFFWNSLASRQMRWQNGTQCTCIKRMLHGHMCVVQSSAAAHIHEHRPPPSLGLNGGNHHHHVECRAERICHIPLRWGSWLRICGVFIYSQNITEHRHMLKLKVLLELKGKRANRHVSHTATTAKIAKRTHLWLVADEKYRKKKSMYI